MDIPANHSSPGPLGSTIIKRVGRGRGITTSIGTPIGECMCTRPYGYVLCNVCGFLAWGRIRYACPAHPQIIFLIDITQCPKCKAYEFMLSEF